MYYKINEFKCIGCSYCKLNCKFNAIVQTQFSNIMKIMPDICTNCGLCKDVCPVDAISCIKETLNER